MTMTREKGFSLVEILVVLAIIGVLVMMYAGALSRARKKAENVATRETFRQDAIGHMASGMTTQSSKGYLPSRDECRAAYRQTVNAGKIDATVTEMKYAVRNEAEFRAYWNTLINPNASGDLESSPSGALVALDESGNRYELAPIGNWQAHDRGLPFPVSWEFISTSSGDMTADLSAINVGYSDGHTEALAYPAYFPICETVARLSDRFLHP